MSRKNIKVIEKEPQGTFDYHYDSANMVLVVRWNSNNFVALVTDCQAVNQIGSGEQYSRVQRKTTVVGFWTFYCAIFDNQMGGVDRMDQNIAYHITSVRPEK